MKRYKVDELHEITEDIDAFIKEVESNQICKKEKRLLQYLKNNREEVISLFKKTLIDENNATNGKKSFYPLE